MKSRKIFLLYIPALFLIVITLYPFLWTLCGTLSKTPQTGRLSIIPEGIKLERYIVLFRDFNFSLWFSNTLVYAVSVTVISSVINSLAAYPLARLNFPGKNFIFILILATMMIPFTVTMIPLFIIISSLGFADSLIALILPGMVSGFNIFLLRQFFLGIPSELEQSAMIDGMSYFGIYLKIVMPLSKPILFTQGTFSFLWAWSNYLWPLVINSDEKYWVLTTGISSFSTQWTTDWNMVLTGTMVSIIPTIILFAVFQTHLIEGVKLSGMK